MAIREKCGVLAFMPRRASDESYDYLLMHLSDLEMIFLNELIISYKDKIEKSEIILAYIFCKSLKKLNHRGYDGYGYSLLSEGKLITRVFDSKVSIGLLSRSILDEIGHNNMITYLVGHVRYSTNDSYSLLDNQPYQTSICKSNIAMCFNGNIDINSNDHTKVNNAECKHMIDFANLSSSSEERLELDSLAIKIKDNVKGAFSALLYNEKTLCAFKDNNGIRPLFHFTSPKLDIISSESYVFHGLDHAYKDEGKSKSLFEKGISKGEYIKSNQVYRFDFYDGELLSKVAVYNKPTRDRLCSFESIYFSCESSELMHSSIKEIRSRLGYLLAKKEKLDLAKYTVAYIPNTAKTSAVAYAKESNVKLEKLICKSDMYERSFIRDKSLINNTLNKKFDIDFHKLDGKKVILIDDSLVRGNTIRYIANELKKNGIKELHVRIASPMINKECNLGVSTKDSELICKDKRIEQLCEELNVDSLVFLEKKELLSIIGEESCTNCLEN